MRLLIISETAHSKINGQIVGHGPTIREIDCLSSLFSDVCHIACLHDNKPPAYFLPYSARNIRLVLVPPAGGKRFRDKVKLLPLYLRNILKEISNAEAVHIRCPASISLVAIILLVIMRYPRIRWVKYAGNWQPNKYEPFSYAFQRLWLKAGLHRGVVTVNGHWPNQPRYVRPFLNPCLTEKKVIEAKSACREKKLSPPFKLLYAGRFDAEKGVARVLEIAGELSKRNIPLKLDIAGDGEERSKLELLTKKLGIDKLTVFHGWLPRDDLDKLYRDAHFIILSSEASEGWPKVLSEAMAYGVVPLVSNISSIPQYLQSFSSGRAFESEKMEDFVEAIVRYIDNRVEWKVESERATTVAKSFTYERYLEEVKRLLKI